MILFLNILKKYQKQICIKEADKEQKNEWLNNLISLLKEKDLYNYLTEDEKRIINKMRKK